MSNIKLKMRVQTTAKYYLGVDKRALRNVAENCLDYSVPTA